MGVSFNWDGTLSPTEFYSSARALSDKWEIASPHSPPWTWVSSTRPFGVTLHEVQGYLSLESFPCPFSIVDDIGDEVHGEEEPACNTKDDATLVHSYAGDIHFYDLHIVLSSSYMVPVLYIRGYRSDGQPLASDDIEKDLPYHSSKIIKDSRWTFMTLEEHPYLNRPWYMLHPCGTSEWMKLLLPGHASVTKDEDLVDQYLLSWLSVVGQVIGLRVPLEAFKKPIAAFSDVDSQP